MFLLHSSAVPTELLSLLFFNTAALFDIQGLDLPACSTQHRFIQWLNEAFTFPSISCPWNTEQRLLESSFV